MPGYKTHLVGGIVAATLVLGVLYYFKLLIPLPDRLILAVPGVLLGSIFSDIDIRTSKAFLVWSLVVTGSLLLFIISILFDGLPSTKLIIAMAGLATLYLLSLFARHRGFFHKYSTGVIFTLPIWFYIGVPAGVAALSAYWSHLVLDKVRPDKSENVTAFFR